MRNKYKLLLNFITLLLLSLNSIGQTSELIFHSGFEPSSTDTTNGIASDIYGIDSSVSSPNDWILDLDEHPNIGNFTIQYEGGDDTMRIAKIIQEPSNLSNHVLHYWLNHPNVGGTKGRIQANLYDNTNLTEISQKVRLYLPSDWNIIKNSGGQVGWLTIMEFWNNANWIGDSYPFRITLGIHKLDSNSTDLNFSLEAQIMPDPPPWPIIWEQHATTYSVPVDEWMTIEYYLKEGDATNGRFFMAVTPDGGQREIIFDITNFTYHPNDPSPNGLTRFNPMKLYTSDALVDYVRTNGGVLQVYWDDFELWKDTNIILGFPENETVNHFNLYPNPTANKFTIQTNENYAEIDVSIYNIIGERVLEVKNQKEIDISKVANGTYFVKTTIDDKIGINKIVKIK